MYYHSLTLKQDAWKIAQVLGSVKQEGYFNVQIATLGGLVIKTGGFDNENGETSVTFFTEKLNLDKLEMAHPAAQILLGLIVNIEDTNVELLKVRA